MEEEDIVSRDVLRVHDGTSWMYFVSKPLCEIKLCEALKRQGVVCYLPLVKKTTEYSRRTYTRMVPMFGGGYVFASTVRQGFDISLLNRNLLKVYYLSETEAVSLLKDLQTVRKYEMLALSHKVEVLTDWKINDTVVIKKGLLKGETAEIQRFKSYDKVVVRLNAIPVSLVAELPVDFLAKE